MTDIHPLPTRRRLNNKQGWIQTELKRFLAERRPCLDGLPPTVAVVVTSIHDRLFETDLSAKTLRRDHAIGNNNFGTHFRNTVGLGMREYIESLRLAAAGRLLRNPELEIYLVSMSVGYSHPETFCRAFQRVLGRTPMQERLVAGENGGLSRAENDTKSKAQEETSGQLSAN